MKFESHAEGTSFVVELTRRNLTALLDKLDDPLSARTLSKMSEDGALFVTVMAVEDDEHYSDRDPGVVFMPSSGEIR